MCGLRDIGDYVFRASRSLDIGEEEVPSPVFEPSAKFPEDAGLAHATLSAQEHVVAVVNSWLQYPQLWLAVEEVVATHPMSGGRFHGGRLLVRRIC